MARQPEIEYIRYYTDGSAARKMQPKAPRKHRPVPKRPAAPRRELVISVDPVSLVAMVVAAVMVVLMAVGCMQLRDARQANARMADYVDRLGRENVLLQDTYETGYDLEAVRQAALALGMVDADEATHITIFVPGE